MTVDANPLCIDLFCGMFGWGRAFAENGWRVVGFDIAHEPYHGAVPDGCELVLQDVLTLHGSQFRNAACIVASPPCQKYSWLAMPWSRSTSEHSRAAKALRRKWETEGPDNRLFDACFRIQREASEAAGRRIPLIVENVRGAQEWVGRAAWSFGSFYLWGDVPALMPYSRPHFTHSVGRDANGNYAGSWFENRGNGTRQDNFRFGKKTQGGSWFRERNGLPQPGIRHEDRGIKGIATDRTTLPDGTGATSWFYGGKRADPRDVRRDENGDYRTPDGLKIGGDWFSDPNSTCRRHGSRSNARKAASAAIAKIPPALAEHIARVYHP
jgi:hypothetical protein